MNSAGGDQVRRNYTPVTIAKEWAFFAYAFGAKIGLLLLIACFWIQYIFQAKKSCGRIINI